MLFGCNVRLYRNGYGGSTGCTAGAADRVRSRRRKALGCRYDQLEARYGWIITYEDPPYENAADFDDVTLDVARDPKNFKGKVLVPRRRRFDFKYPNADQPQAEDVLAAVIRDYNMAGNNDAFRLLRTGKFFHVVPSVSDNNIGLPTNRQSRLDVRVTIPDAERSVLETLKVVVAQVRELTGVPMVIGRVPTNLLLQRRCGQAPPRNLLGTFSSEH